MRASNLSNALAHRSGGQKTRNFDDILRAELNGSELRSWTVDSGNGVRNHLLSPKPGKGKPQSLKLSRSSSNWGGVGPEI
jgi:hypothetical protein